MEQHVGKDKGGKKSYIGEKLQAQVETELGEALKFIGRTANLLRQADWDRGATKAAEALEQVTVSIMAHIDNLLER